MGLVGDDGVAAFIGCGDSISPTATTVEDDEDDDDVDDDGVCAICEVCQESARAATEEDDDKQSEDRVGMMTGVCATGFEKTARGRRRRMTGSLNAMTRYAR